jgi:hypothetical protein
MTNLDAAVTDYWHQHYTRKGVCCLCGNSGVLDTRGVRTPAGIECGALAFCICPNGQTMRAVDAEQRAAHFDETVESVFQIAMYGDRGNAQRMRQQIGDALRACGVQGETK